MKNKTLPTMTAKFVEHVKADPTRRQELRASPPSGLFLVVSTQGKKTWFLRYRHRGRTRNMKLGVYPILTLAEAREKAVTALRDLGRGSDPATKPREGSDGVAAAAELWLKLVVSQQDTAYETQRVVRKEIIPPWRNKKVGEITKRDVHALLDAKAADGSPVMANRIHAILSRWLGWLVQRDYIAFSPMAGVPKPHREKSRERVLSDSEMSAVWNAAATLTYPFREFLQVYFLLGQREDQTGNMRWTDLDLIGGIWHAPAADAKMRKATEIPLSAPVLAILNRIPRFAGPYVFSHSAGQRPMAGFPAAKKALDAAVEAAGHVIEHWVLHDSRRCLKTFFSKTGVPPIVANLALGHSRRSSLGSLESIYDQHSYLNEKRSALDAWALHLTSREAKAAAAVAS